MKKQLFSFKICFMALAFMLSLPNVFGQPAITTLTFNYTGSVQNFTVPSLCVNSITIEARGAQGGSFGGNTGGLGARIIGDVAVNPGNVLQIYVGGQGVPSQNAGGGGGGSGVANGATPLVIAGGGGGACNVTPENGQPGQATTSGGNSSGAGGTGGNGGQKGYKSGDCGWAGGGGGFLGDGYGGPQGGDGGALPGTLGGPAGGKGRPNGGAGGLGGSCGFSGTGSGGWGCGGGGRAEYGGGGGGGYSGGGGGQYVDVATKRSGGGGGSYNAGNTQVNTAGYQSGNGIVIISYSSGNAISVTATPTLICSGFASVLNAIGPDTYSWSTGQSGSQISVYPTGYTTYTATGTDPVTGCAVTATTAVFVLQSPPISIFTSKQSVCEGESVTMQGLSGLSYTWSVGPSFNAIITVTPTQGNNTYTVIGNNAIGCTAQAVQTIVINPLPVPVVTGNTLICQGFTTTLNASGAASFVWKSNSLYLEANPVALSPQSTTVYSVTGTSTANCKGTSVVVVAVDPCTGIKTNNGATTNVSVYPNPNSGIFTVSLTNGLSKTIDVTDVTGRIILSNTTTNDQTDVNISTLASGVYYVKVRSENISEVIKIVKQ